MQDTLTATLATRLLERRAAESIKHDLRLSDRQLGLLGGIPFGLFYAAVGLPLARLADRSDRRSLLAGALALWSGNVLAYATGGFLNDTVGWHAAFLLLAGAVHGLGAFGTAAQRRPLNQDRDAIL